MTFKDLCRWSECFRNWWAAEIFSEFTEKVWKIQRAAVTWEETICGGQRSEEDGQTAFSWSEIIARCVTWAYERYLENTTAYLSAVAHPVHPCTITLLRFCCQQDNASHPRAHTISDRCLKFTALGRPPQYNRATVWLSMTASLRIRGNTSFCKEARNVSIFSPGHARGAETLKMCGAVVKKDKQ